MTCPYQVALYPASAGRYGLEALHELASKLVVETALRAAQPFAVPVRE